MDNNVGQDRRAKYPYHGLEIGAETVIDCATKKEVIKIRCAAHGYGAYQGKAFETEMVEGGIRVKRIG